MGAFQWRKNGNGGGDRRERRVLVCFDCVCVFARENEREKVEERKRREGVWWLITVIEETRNSQEEKERFIFIINN